MSLCRTRAFIAPSMLLQGECFNQSFEEYLYIEESLLRKENGQAGIQKYFCQTLATQ